MTQWSLWLLKGQGYFLFSFIELGVLGYNRPGNHHRHYLSDSATNSCEDRDVLKIY